MALARLGFSALLLTPGGAAAYPGGTPDFQTDMLPACAACHSSLSEQVLSGSEARAKKELAENKHIALILAGEKGYGELSQADRELLAQHIRAVDDNTHIELEHPPHVAPGETFQVTLRVSGGAGPVVGVALVDRAHRWYARAATVVGWTIAGPPTVIGPNGRPQSEWLERRPDRFGREISFVNITGVESDAAAGSWAKSKLIFTLKAPDRPGDYPLVGALFYGTEKASPLGFTSHPIYGEQVRGGYAGSSGRLKFTDPKLITVK
jgi:hypothetical protein